MCAFQPNKHYPCACMCVHGWVLVYVRYIGLGKYEEYVSTYAAVCMSGHVIFYINVPALLTAVKNTPPSLLESCLSSVCTVEFRKHNLAVIVYKQPARRPELKVFFVPAILQSFRYLRVNFLCYASKKLH